jgi:hypothetical protein
MIFLENLRLFLLKIIKYLFNVTHSIKIGLGLVYFADLNARSILQ